MEASEFTRDDLGAELERLHEASYGWALSCSGWNDADAEDVLQTTYVKVISGKARFGGRSAFRTWLFGVIRQTAWEHGRRARSHRQRAERLALEVPVGEVEAADVGAESAERSKALLLALAELPDRQREVLHLVFYQDLTIREAAEVMDVSLGSARVHYERGKKRLRTLLSDERKGREGPEGEKVGMSDTPVDEGLRQRFQELRAATQQSGGVPEFSGLLARAEAEVAARPALEVVAGGAMGSRRRWALVGAWGSAALAATVAGLLLVRSGPSPDEEFARLVASYSTEVSAGAWRSPTSGLLEVPGMELTRSMPSIGAPLPQYDAIEPPEPGAAPRDDA